MPSENFPVVVLVPGAFGTPAGYEKLLPYLNEAGISTHPGPYPSCDPADPLTANCPDDIASLRDNVLLPLIDDQQKDVVILAHSYGGVVAGGAAKNLDKQARKAQGQAGGVIGLIYVAGNITLEGESLAEAVGGAYPPFIKVDKVRTNHPLWPLLDTRGTGYRHSLSSRPRASRSSSRPWTFYTTTATLHSRQSWRRL